MPLKRNNMTFEQLLEQELQSQNSKSTQPPQTQHPLPQHDDIPIVSQPAIQSQVQIPSMTPRNQIPDSKRMTLDAVSPKSNNTGDSPSKGPGIHKRFKSRFDDVPNFIQTTSKKESTKKVSGQNKKNYLQRGQGKGGGKGFNQN